MPRRAVLSAAERSALLAVPTTEGDLIRHYTFGEQDLARIHQHRGGHNRLGFAVQRAVFFNRLGELRDRSFEHQRYRASGLTLVIAAIALWNTVYLERAVKALRARGQVIDEDLLQRLSPLGWEHINLTGDYTWRPGGELGSDGYRPLRSVPEASL